MQATIYNITPFDATVGTTIRFGWNGNQIYKNRCIIKTNETNEVVYDKTIDSLKLEHTIDLTNASLQNGVKYVAYITVFDAYNVESDMQSVGQFFICLKTPIFTFSNLIENQTVENSSYNFILNYVQENGELLNSWQMTIYSIDNVVLSSTNVKYDTTSLEHVFTGFSNDTPYKIRATGQTVNGFPLDTGYIPFLISFGAPAIFSMIELTNLPEQGAILLHSNIISANGELKNPAEYINNDYIDLTENELMYNEGFILEDDFSLIVYSYKIKPNIPFFTFSINENGDFKGYVTYRVGNIGSANMVGCLELRIVNGDGVPEYVIYSNKINPITESDILGFCLTRNNGYYDIAIKNLGEVNITT